MTAAANLPTQRSGASGPPSPVASTPRPAASSSLGCSAQTQVPSQEHRPALPRAAHSWTSARGALGAGKHAAPSFWAAALRPPATPLWPQSTPSSTFGSLPSTAPSTAPSSALASPVAELPCAFAAKASAQPSHKSVKPSSAPASGPAWPPRTALPPLLKLRDPRAPQVRKAPGYYVAADYGPASYRATPTRVRGGRAKVRWGLDASGRAVAVHVAQRRDDDTLARQQLERAALAAIGRAVAPWAEYVDGKGRHVRISALWHTDLYTALDELDGAEETRWVARKVLRDVAASYVRLHARGLVHNDVKPENILLRTDGELGLTDVDCTFFTHPLAPLELRFASLGSSSYPCPEACDDATNAGCAVDIFRLGTCLLSVYDPWTYAEFVAGGEESQDYAREYERAADSLALLARMQAERRGRLFAPLASPELGERARALDALVEHMRALDPQMHALVLDEMLDDAPARRPSAARLLARAEEMLPYGSAGEASACVALGRACEARPEVLQQRRDLASLAKMPPTPTPRPPQP